VKILTISSERGWHGGEEQLRQLVDGLSRQGHQCHLVARSSGSFTLRMEAAGWPVTRLPGSTRGPRAVWRLRRAISLFAPDVIHANDSQAVTLARLATWLPGGRKKAGSLPGGSKRAIRIASRRVLFPIRSTKKYLSWCDRVVCVSHAIASVCHEAGIPQEIVRVVHSGVDPRRVASGDSVRGRKSLGLAADVPMILCVGQLAPYKGHRYLLQALALLIQRWPDARLVLAGDGPQDGPLRKLAEQLGISSALHLLGYRTDVPDLICACDLLVLASPAEGLGTSVLDAMFAGKPVVGTEAGGIPEILGDQDGQGAVGWLVPPADSGALAATIAAALGSKRLRQQYGLAGQQRAQAHFTAGQMVDRMLAVYSELSAPPAESLLRCSSHSRACFMKL
jgi:glycosyltransferase involved in cell wall biosynthesis